MKKFDTTNFTRIQVPIMLLANLMLFLGMLFLSPDWVFGIPEVYPPYSTSKNTLFEKVSDVAKTITAAAPSASAPK